MRVFGMIEYPIGESEQVVVLQASVLLKFQKSRQRRWWQPESGGQLFARISGTRIVVEEATGPRRTDKRSRTSYIPDRKAEQREIDARSSKGLHYVGDWHTHPEAIPRPSSTDIVSIAELVQKSTHMLNGFLLVIVGQADPPDGLHALVHDGTRGFVLQTCSKGETGGTR